MCKLKGHLLPYIKEHKARALGSLLFAFILSGIKLYETKLVQPILDKGLSADASFHDTLYYVLMLLGLGLLNFLN